MHCALLCSDPKQEPDAICHGTVRLHHESGGEDRPAETEILKDISVFLPWRKNRRAWPQWCWQVNPAEDHGRDRYDIQGEARPQPI